MTQKTGTMIQSTSLRDAPGLNARITGILEKDEKVTIKRTITEGTIVYAETVDGKYFIVSMGSNVFWKETSEEKRTWRETIKNDEEPKPFSRRNRLFGDR